MKYICRVCRNEYSLLKNMFPNFQGLLDQMRPGDLVPDGQCPDCGGLAYAAGRFASQQEIFRARDLYQCEEIEVDDYARASYSDEHVWVQAWVYVPT